MDPKIFQRLVGQAREDAQFFHVLVFQPEKVLEKLDYLDEAAKEAVRRTDPQALIALLVGELGTCGGSETCSCTSGTCGDTCGGSTCSATCTGDSCGRTCDNSCGYTTNLGLVDRERWARTAPAAQIPVSALPAVAGCDAGTSCGETCPCTNSCTGNSCGVTSQFDPFESILEGMARRRWAIVDPVSRISALLTLAEMNCDFTCTETCSATCGEGTCAASCGETKSLEIDFTEEPSSSGFR